MGIYTDDSREYGIKLFAKNGNIHKFCDFVDNKTEDTKDADNTWQKRTNEFLQMNKDEEFIVVAFLYNVSCTFDNPPSISKSWHSLGAYIYYYEDESYDRAVELLVVKNELNNRRTIKWPETLEWFVMVD